MSKLSRHGELWNKEELILAFELYCRIPFAKTKANNPFVKKLAYRMGRTPASIARKLGNFGAFDPELQKRNISGLSHGSKLDKEVWEQFHRDWPGLVAEAESLRTKFKISERPETYELPMGPSEKPTVGKRRLHQAFFRDAVLSSYCACCAVTGISIPDCLVASHIVPWSKSKESRANPQNGICLSATFDRLYDRGLMTITTEFNIKLSRSLLSAKDPSTRKYIVVFDGATVTKPERFVPDAAFLEWHQTHIFRKG